MLVVVVVLLFLVLVQGLTKVSDQSRALEDRNDSNNSLEVCTPNSFIYLFYNSPDMDVVDMHNILIIPSDSVLWEKTMEASYLVGSFPCQFDLAICVWHPCLGWSLGTGNLWTFLPFPVGCSQQISTVPTPSNGGNPGIKVSHKSTVPTPSNGGNPGIKVSHMSTVPKPSNGGNPGIKDSLNSPLSVTADRCEK